MNDLQAWAIWKYDDVDSILMHPNFDAHFIENQNTENKIQLDQQLLEFRSNFVRLLKENQPFIKEVILNTVTKETTKFRTNNTSNISKNLIRPCCHNICLKLSGISEEEANHHQLFAKSKAIFDMTNGSQVEINQGEKATQYLASYFQQLCKTKKLNPQNDLISTFVKAENNANLLISPLIQMFVGICESVPLLLGSILLSLQQNPHILIQLKDNLREHFNEIIRYAGPAQLVVRYCLKDCTYKDTNFKKGERIFVYLWSANRDASIFKDPHLLKLDRKAQSHMSFGKGIHSCLGASVVREICIKMLEQMLDTFSLDQISWQNAEFSGSKTIKGMHNIQLKV